MPSVAPASAPAPASSGAAGGSKSAVAPSTPGAPSAAVTALNAQRESNISKGLSPYAGTAASLATFTSANPKLSTAGGSGGGPEAGFNADGSIINPTYGNSGTPTSTSSSTNPPTVVTSGQSRTTYANNVTSLNKTLGNISPNNSSVSVVDYLNKSGMPSDYSSRAALAVQHGIPNYTGSATQNMQLLGMLQGSGGNDKGTGGGPSKGGTNQPVPPPVSGISTDTAAPVGGAPASGAAVTDTKTPATGTVTTPTSNPDGTTTDPNDLTSGLPPAVASAFKDTLTQQEQNIEQAQNTLAQAKATMMNDPAATAAASMIESHYATLIQNMRDKNNIVLGSYRTNAARNGSLQYANDMETNFMSNEMDRASTRLADLVTKESELVLKSNIAYKNADVKAFNTAQTALTKATTDKETTLGKLLTATNNQVKAVQAQQKLDMATKKNELSTDVTTSAKIADEMAQALGASGTTDQASIDSYVKEMAASNGIKNLDILKSALVKAQQSRTKANLSAENTRSIINKRGKGGGAPGGKGGTDGAYSYSAGDVASYSNLLNQGGTDPHGNTFSKRGADGFVDPGAYNAALSDWVKNGGTPAGFAKKFPVKGNINPTSYTALPAAIQPKATPAAGGTNGGYQA